MTNYWWIYVRPNNEKVTDNTLVRLDWKRRLHAKAVQPKTEHHGIVHQYKVDNAIDAGPFIY